MLTKAFVGLLIITGCFNYPITFPGQEGPGTSPLVGGVSCHSTGEHAMACTDWDGHHTLNVCVGEGPTLACHPYSDLGADWGQVSMRWHEITAQQSAQWNEDRDTGSAPPARCPNDEEQWWTRGSWASQRDRFEAYERIPR
jgi:hypothetical protein